MNMSNSMYERIPQLGCRSEGIVDNGVHRRSSKKKVGRFEVPHYPIARLTEVIRTQEIDRVLVPSVDDAAAFPEILRFAGR